MEIEKITYMFEIDIKLRNSSQKMGVRGGSYNGLGVPKTPRRPAG